MKQRNEKEFEPNASVLNHNAYKIGCDYYNKGRYKNALKAFTESLEYWPEDPEAWLALGNCYDKLNSPVKAEECFRKSLIFAPFNNRNDALFNLGNSLFDQEKFVEAIEYYAKVSAQSSVYSAAQLNMERARDGDSSKKS